MIRTFVKADTVYYNLHDICDQYSNIEFFHDCRSVRESIRKNAIPFRKCVYVSNGKRYNKRFMRAEVYIDEATVRERGLMRVTIPSTRVHPFWMIVSMAILYGLPLFFTMVCVGYHQMISSRVGLIV